MFGEDREDRWPVVTLRLTWGEEDDGSETGKLIVGDVQLPERLDQLLLDTKSHAG